MAKFGFGQIRPNSLNAILHTALPPTNQSSHSPEKMNSAICTDYLSRYYVNSIEIILPFTSTPTTLPFPLLLFVFYHVFLVCTAFILFIVFGPLFIGQFDANLRIYELNE